MSTQVQAWFERAYVKGATHVYQSKGKLLAGTTRDPDDIKANEVYWRVAGRMESQPRSSVFELLRMQGGSRNTVNATMTHWQAPDSFKHADINSMSENEQETIQKAAGFALGRRHDKLIMDELGTLAVNPVTTLGDGTGTIGIIDILEAEGRIMGKGVPDDTELFCPLPQKFWNQLKLFKEFSNSDYVGPEYPMVKRTMVKKYGFTTYFLCPDELFPSVVADSFDTFMWVKSAMGFATNYEMGSKITWENAFDSYVANNWMSGVAKQIMPEGIMRLRFKNNAALVRQT